MVDGSARKGDEDRDSGRGTRDTTNPDCPTTTQTRPLCRIFVTCDGLSSVKP
jgi:hypothetical protein